MDMRAPLVVSTVKPQAGPGFMSVRSATSLVAKAKDVSVKVAVRAVTETDQGGGEAKQVMTA